MNLSRIMIASLNLVLAVNSFAGGFSTWEQTTPGNNTIFHDDGPHRIRIFCKPYPYYNANHLIINNIQKWYFKKDYIIGEYLRVDSTNNKMLSFFIFNESNCEIELFSSKEKWIERIYLKGLNNIIWTREHKSNWGFYNLGDIGEGIAFLTIGIPFIVIFLIVLSISILRYKFSVLNPLTTIILTIVAILLFLYLGDIYPYSI